MSRVWFKSYDPRVSHTASYPDKCLPRLLENCVRKFPENVATMFFGATLHYRELWDHIQRLASAFYRMGMRPGTRAAIMLPNCPQSVIAYYAVLWVGGVVVMTNPLYVERELEYQWKDSEAEFLIVLDHLFPKARKVIPGTAIRKVVVTSIREYFPIHLKVLYPIAAKFKRLFTSVPYDDKTTFNFSRLIRYTVPPAPPCPVKLDDLALLQYTGGTTGVSKGVMLSHRNIMSNVIQLATWFPDLQHGRERFLAILPFFHAFGMTVAMNLPIYSGSTTILVPRFHIDEIIRTLRKYKPTVFPGVPTIYAAINAHPKVESFDLSSIRFCVTGSAPMPLDALRKFERLTGSIMVEGFGLSEASPVTHANPIEGKRKEGSIGIALPDTDCKIVDLEFGTMDLPVGEAGELVVRGPQVMNAYWKKPEETENVLRDGWLHTGDIARMDDEGYVYIIDRKKDMIISNGYNIYPREVDEVLYEHPKVMDAVAVGVPDPQRGEVVKAYIVLRPGEAMTEDEIKRFCRERLAPFKVPRLIEFRDSLPKTAVGKISRNALRTQAVLAFESRKVERSVEGLR